VSRRLRSQTSQVLVTPFPGRGCGRSLRNTTRALLMMYVCTPAMSSTFCISDTRITSWYDDLRICSRNKNRACAAVSKKPQMEGAHLQPVQERKLLSDLWIFFPPDASILDW